MAPNELPPPSGPAVGGTEPPRPHAPTGSGHRTRFWLVVGAAAAALAVGGVLGARAGGGGSSTSPATDRLPATTSGSVPVTDRPPAPVRTTVATSPPTAPPVPVTYGEGIMPDVVCMNLQDAQDEIQKHGVFFSRSKDATGKGRRQILDRNWIVVAQSPAPGVPIGEGDAVLSVVKNDEPNDC